MNILLAAATAVSFYVDQTCQVQVRWEQSIAVVNLNIVGEPNQEFVCVLGKWPFKKPAGYLICGPMRVPFSIPNENQMVLMGTLLTRVQYPCSHDKGYGEKWDED